MVNQQYPEGHGARSEQASPSSCWQAGAKLPTQRADSLPVSWRTGEDQMEATHFSLIWSEARLADPQSSGAVWKSKWPSWAPVPNKPTISMDVKQRFIIITLTVARPHCLCACHQWQGLGKSDPSERSLATPSHTRSGLKTWGWSCWTSWGRNVRQKSINLKSSYAARRTFQPKEMTST